MHINIPLSHMARMNSIFPKSTIFKVSSIKFSGKVAMYNHTFSPLYPGGPWYPGGP